MLSAGALGLRDRLSVQQNGRTRSKDAETIRLMRNVKAEVVDSVLQSSPINRTAMPTTLSTFLPNRDQFGDALFPFDGCIFAEWRGNVGAYGRGVNWDSFPNSTSAPAFGRSGLGRGVLNAALDLPSQLGKVFWADHADGRDVASL